MAPTNEESKKQDIFDQLTWDDRVNASDISVSVLGDIAELNGTVPTYATKLAAEGNAYLVSDIIDVRNNLAVDFPTDEAVPSDLEITSSIENKLKWDSQINPEDIQVETTNGIVSLSGMIDSYWEKIRAEDLTRHTHGVIDVDNNLTVTPLKSTKDVEIENDIKKAFRRSDLIDEEKINVTVNRGIVRLSGIAPNYFIKARIYDIATYSAGVRDIIDNITIA